jgi:cyclopropane fatty-acyl-phospholipid synthase-like methyltransferase
MSPSMSFQVSKEISENEITLNIDGAMSDPLICEGASPSMRDLVKEYWCNEHKEATLENMLLDSKASVIDALERPEVLSKLPSVRGLRVLELGAGIGRFTRILAEQHCQEIVAVDFQDTACAENRRVNVDNSNVRVICQDATTLDFEAESFDFIFSNWLLMYLSDEEVSAFFTNCLKWLKPGGKLFFRESCMHRSGDATRSFNPSRYRHPNEYFAHSLESRIADASMRFCVLEHGRIATYVKVKNNPNQFYWMLRKVRSQNADCLPASPLSKPMSHTGRELIVMRTPATDLIDYLKTSRSLIHVLTFPNVLSVADIQELSAVPNQFSFDVLEELAEFECRMPRAFAAAHFHGFTDDSIELRAFTVKVAGALAPAATVTGLPDRINEILNALIAA